MKILCAVRDTATETFGSVMTFKNEKDAVRSFTTAVNDPNPDSLLSQHPEDYELWQLATYNEDTGTIRTDNEGISMIARAKDLVAKKES